MLFIVGLITNFTIITKEKLRILLFCSERGSGPESFLAIHQKVFVYFEKEHFKMLVKFLAIFVVAIKIIFCYNLELLWISSCNKHQLFHHYITRFTKFDQSIRIVLSYYTSRLHFHGFLLLIIFLMLPRDQSVKLLHG